jgi:hypothetical protein
MQKHIAFWMICLGLAIALPYRSQAFEYDVWKSGMPMNEALQVAEVNDIPLTCMEFNTPLQRGRDHFRAGVVTRAKKTQNLCYRQELMGSTALITLHFTPMSKQLSYIVIYWTDADRAQKKEAVLDLSEKFGEPAKYSPQKDVFAATPDIRLENNVSETQFFIPDKHNIITTQYLEKAKNDLRIIYYNTSLSRLERTEFETFEHYIKTRYRQQDENRM